MTGEIPPLTAKTNLESPTVAGVEAVPDMSIDSILIRQDSETELATKLFPE